MTNGMNEREVDLHKVDELVAALEQDIAKISGDSPELQRLKDELQTLRNVLDSPVRRHHWVRDGLHGIRESIDAVVDEIVLDGIKGSQYVAQIGRILGL